MSKNKPWFTMLVGLPACGKSTWRANALHRPHTVFLSTDDEIEKLCAAQGITYDQGFKLFIDQAQKIMNEKMADAIRNRVDMVLDRTNLTKKSRARSMAQLPKEYIRRAFFFPIPDDTEWKRRLNSRPGKCIPQAVLDEMRLNFEMPSIDEGFDEVLSITNT